MNEKSIFAEALERGDAAERSAFLDQACGDDAKLRHRVEVLLQAHDEAGSFLDKPAAQLEGTSDVALGQWLDAGGIPDAPIEGVGSRIKQYKLLQQIGEGGMGVVFMAEQQEPVRRMVALKVIKAGMDTAQVIARFEAERQALALMDHPNIAKVLDAGTTASGRPFFVMELVKGIPMTKYCDEQRLSPKQRLELFVPVCQAIQHAHQKGIIHRDIKPSNVLIAAYDGKPVPKVIDFGVAKATGQKLTERTLFTGFGGLVGTFEYMSPEQAEFNALDIDTRSDVYALGVLLYELLTGTTPLSRQRIKDAAIMEVLRLIREEEPPRPSTRLSESKETLATVAAQRQTEPAALVKAVRGEVDWIVMKALDKDRTRRYETATGLARDIERYLSDEPVMAGPPSARYRLRKLAWKYRRGLATATAFVLILLAATMVSAWQAIRATVAEKTARQNETVAVRERNQKEIARQEAEQRAEEARIASAAEKQARHLAQRRLQEIQKANALLAAIFQDMNPRDLKARDEGNDIPDLRQQLSQRLDSVADRLNHTAIDDPATLADLQYTLGQSLSYLGRTQRAIALLHDAWTLRKSLLGPSHDDTLQTAIELAAAYRSANQHEKALPLVEDALARWKERLADDDPRTRLALNALALSYNAGGQPNKALPLFQKILDKDKASLADNDPITLAHMHNLGSAYCRAGQFDKAVDLLQKTLAGREAKHGVDHFVTTRTRALLADAYLGQNRSDKAIPLLQQVLRQREKTLGTNHPETRSSRFHLASAYSLAGRSVEAIPLYEEYLEQREGQPGNEPSNALFARNNLAMAYLLSNRVADSIPLFEQNLEQCEAKLGKDHATTKTFRANLKAARNLKPFAERYRQARARKGEEAEETLEAWDHYAWNLGRNQLVTEGAREYCRLLAVGLRVFRAGNARAEQWAIDYLQFVANSGRCDAEALADAKAILGDKHPQLALFVGRWTAQAATLLLRRRAADAEPLLRQCVDLRRTIQPDAWQTFHTQALLGASLLSQKKYAAAEPLLLKGYRGMKEREDKIPPQCKIRLTEALERLVQLYEATDKKDEADKWRQELSAAKSSDKK